MKITRRLPLLAGILALGAGSPVFAQISQQTQQVTVTASIPVLMNLSIDTSTVNINFTQSDYAVDGTGSKEALNATTLKVASNARWKIEVGADSANFSYDGVTVPNKPCGDLSLSPNGTANYAPVTLIARELARGDAGGNTVAANIVPVSYKLDTTIAGDPPGNYTLTLTYTLMPQ